jgi:hypothetical protein
VQVGKVRLPPPVPTLAQALANYQPAVQTLLDNGLDAAGVLQGLRQRLTEGKAKGLHLVPVRLKASCGFDAGVQDAYRDTYVDAMQRNDRYPSLLVLGGYHGDAAGYCTVDPMYLEIDEQRVEALVRAHTAGDDSALVERALASAFAALDQRERPMPVVPWTPGPERFADPAVGCAVSA